MNDSLTVVGLLVVLLILLSLISQLSERECKYPCAVFYYKSKCKYSQKVKEQWGKAKLKCQTTTIYNQYDKDGNQTIHFYEYDDEKAKVKSIPEGQSTLIKFKYSALHEVVYTGPLNSAFISDFINIHARESLGTGNPKWDNNERTVYSEEESAYRRGNVEGVRGVSAYSDYLRADKGMSSLKEGYLFPGYNYGRPRLGGGWDKKTGRYTALSGTGYTGGEPIYPGATTVGGCPCGGRRCGCGRMRGCPCGGRGCGCPCGGRRCGCGGRGCGRKCGTIPCGERCKNCPFRGDLKEGYAPGFDRPYVKPPPGAPYRFRTNHGWNAYHQHRGAFHPVQVVRGYYNTPVYLSNYGLPRYLTPEGGECYTTDNCVQYANAQIACVKEIGNPRGVCTRVD